MNSSLWTAYAFTSKPYDLYIAVSSLPRPVAHLRHLSIYRPVTRAHSAMTLGEWECKDLLLPFFCMLVATLPYRSRSSHADTGSFYFLLVLFSAVF